MQIMLVFKYSKINGAEYISHLDTLRHIQKTFIRAKVAVDYSKGYNPHMRFFMSAPIGVGIRSTSEFCCAEISLSADKFLERINDFCPDGLKIEWAADVKKNPNLASIINSALYELEGEISDDIIKRILEEREIYMPDKRGENKEVRDKIFSLNGVDGKLYAKLSFGNSTLRADVFCDWLNKTYGYTCGRITKKEAYINGEKAEDYIVKNFA